MTANPDAWAVLALLVLAASVWLVRRLKRRSR